MRTWNIVAGTLGLSCAIWAVAACGTKTPSPFDNANHPNDDAGSTDEPPSLGEAGDDAPSCTGIACQVVNCADGNHTTISGTVYDPMGRTPLYNVYVYVPNAPLQDMPGAPVACTQCQAPASGSPLPGAVQTDAKGHFQVMDVPVGSNIPLVMQIGKFRRQITISTVKQCVDNAVGTKDKSGNETLTRMPRQQHEGVGGVPNVNDYIPQIAMATGGCDQLECLMRKIGIADSEFSATGRVHLFQGRQGVTGPGSSDAYAFWSNKTELFKHDIVMNSCECAPVDRTPAYGVMHDYVDGGGRLFGTHYHYNWFAPPTGPADFQSTAQWFKPMGGSATYYINTTFPKGQAFSDWIQNVYQSAPPPKGQIVLEYASRDVGIVNGTTTPWIYTGDPDLKNKAYSTTYLSFNAPVALPADKQCGRAVFSDLHVSEGQSPPGAIFPNECGSPTDPLTQQETALEFLFFDLSSCVQDDLNPPPPPPPN